MRVPVIGVEMMVWMTVPRAVRVDVLVLMKDDFEFATEGVGDTAQCSQAWNMLSAFQPRDHGLGHAQFFGEFQLGFPLMGAKTKKRPGTLCSKSLRIVAAAGSRGRGHKDFAKVES